MRCRSFDLWFEILALAFEWSRKVVVMVVVVMSHMAVWVLRRWLDWRWQGWRRHEPGQECIILMLALSLVFDRHLPLPLSFPVPIIFLSW